MAELVDVMVVPHDPTLPGWVQDPPWPFIEGARDEVQALRSRLAEAAPDVIVMVGSDHFSQFFLDAMPAFLVAKPTRVRGPFPDEAAGFGLEPYDVPCDRALARALLRGGMERDVDFAASDDVVVDHAFTIPLNFIRPEQDIPVVPVFTNVMAPPVPPGRRFHRVGEVIREVIEAYDADQRVAVVTTAHMSNGVGGPNSLRPNPEWDRRMWELIEAGAVQEIVEAATFEQLYAIGSNTAGFLNFCLAFGVAGGVAPTRSHFAANPQGPGNAFLAWDVAALSGAPA